MQDEQNNSQEEVAQGENQEQGAEQQAVNPLSQEFINLVAMDLQEFPDNMAVGFKALIRKGDNPDEVKITDVQVVPVTLDEPEESSLILPRGVRD